MSIDLELAPGKRIGTSPWILERRLGRGAFGEVWAAHHEHTLVVAAIKCLVALGVGEKSAIFENKVLRAAQLLVRVDHPHVVKVLDVGYVGESPKRIWVVMELLAGRELSKALAAEGPFEPGRALRHIAAAASAVATVHAAATAEAMLERSLNPEADTPEFVHRDLKPDNLMLVDGARGETIKVLDFDAAHMPRAKSMVGQIVGTPYYMSPEQWRGEKVDSRADVWALGVIFYEMLTGKKPFNGTNLPELAAAVVRQPFPTRPASLPPDLWELVVTATQKDRGPRPTISDFAAETQRLLLRDPSSGAAVVYAETARLSSAELARVMTASSPDGAQTLAGEPPRQSTQHAYASSPPVPVLAPARASLNTGTAIAIAAIALLGVAGVVVGVTAAMRSDSDPATASSTTEPSSKPAEDAPVAVPMPSPATSPPEPPPIVSTTEPDETAPPPVAPSPPPAKVAVPPPPRPTPPPPPKTGDRW